MLLSIGIDTRFHAVGLVKGLSPRGAPFAEIIKDVGTILGWGV
jgi:hypothetical protein